ncbi:uncharacterized protein [Clytia hemisphaerica]|uniref:uncharacterized protein n=1 Tax=Clytia hemisphaerica TaxID=252671 RepID=UPI0034D76F00
MHTTTSSSSTSKSECRTVSTKPIVLKSKIKEISHNSGCSTEAKTGKNSTIPSIATAAELELRMPTTWLEYLNKADIEWVNETLFTPTGQLVEPIKIWHEPPKPNPHSKNEKPIPSDYFRRRFCLWVPKHKHKYQFRCPNCPNEELRPSGIYKRLRIVLDIKDWYYLGTEKVSCRKCGKNFIGWDNRLLDQLSIHIRSQFPALLTLKYGCDISLISFLKSRTLGNSPNAFLNTLKEIHSETWIKQNIAYLADCLLHRKRMFFADYMTTYDIAQPIRELPGAQWFLAAYVRDVWSRKEEIKGAISSVFGRVLKIDSTNKILKKLAGNDKDSAKWVTNLGNEYGSILQLIVTTSESMEALKPIANGIMQRYKRAKVKLPEILYTDRDCCRQDGPSVFKVLFDDEDWKYMIVCLDIWHYMRRLALGLTTESHPLYGTFLKRLSGCIFEWNQDDFRLLLEAKKSEMVLIENKEPSDATILKSLNRKEIARHCQRKTRSHDEIIQSIERLILEMTGVTDLVGVPLLKDDMVDVWTEQKCHVRCILDPDGIQLYTKVSTQKKGTVELPVYRCARGSTSLESFHQHIKNFIPGRSANALNFQAYLLDGLMRWNANRKDAIDGSLSTLKSFDLKLVEKFNKLHLEVHNERFDENQKAPNKSCNEIIGMEFLYSQCNKAFEDEDVDEQIDEGCDMAASYEECDSSDEDERDEEIDFAVEGLVVGRDNSSEEFEENDEKDQSITETDDSTDSRGIPGWQKIDHLAKALIETKGISLSSSEKTHIVQLYHNLEEFDKKPLKYEATKKKSTKGRFARRNGNGEAGHVKVTEMARSFLSGTAAAFSPSKSRLVEAICIHLCIMIPAHVTTCKDNKKKFRSRWSLIIEQYNNIRAIILCLEMKRVCNCIV